MIGSCIMSEEKEVRQRFFRDGAPYFKDFEIVVSQLFGESQNIGNKAVADVTIQLMHGIHDHLANCQALLGSTEDMIEKARKENEPADKIEQLSQLCLLQL